MKPGDKVLIKDLNRVGIIVYRSDVVFAIRLIDDSTIIEREENEIELWID